MMTPPLSMSAMPRLTRCVPVPAAGPVTGTVAAGVADPAAAAGPVPGAAPVAELVVLAGALWTDTKTSLDRCWWPASMVGAGFSRSGAACQIGRAHV